MQNKSVGYVWSVYWMEKRFHANRLYSWRNNYTLCDPCVDNIINIWKIFRVRIMTYASCSSRIVGRTRISFWLPLLVYGTVCTSLLRLRWVSSGRASSAVFSSFPSSVPWCTVPAQWVTSCHFGHFNRSCYLLTYLLTYARSEIIEFTYFLMTTLNCSDTSASARWQRSSRRSIWLSRYRRRTVNQSGWSPPLPPSPHARRTVVTPVTSLTSADDWQLSTTSAGLPSASPAPLWTSATLKSITSAERLKTTWAIQHKWTSMFMIKL